MDFVTEIRGRTLEYYDLEHLYLVDGVAVPSITQLLGKKFPNKYKGIDPDVLREAARRGTEVHQAIEDYCTKGLDSYLPEVRGFKTLKRLYNFEVCGNEVPVILFSEDFEPVAAGRLDLVLRQGDRLGLGDIKRTSVLDKEYLAWQLNLYRIAYQQDYSARIEFLAGIHLRDEVMHYVNLPIKEDMIFEFIKELKDE